jgi:hypothetical protein
VAINQIAKLTEDIEMGPEPEKHEVGDQSATVSKSALNSVVSLQDVNGYFYQDEDEACEENTNTFVERVIEIGFDSSVDEHLRYLVVIWALADPGDAAGRAGDAVKKRLSAS